MRYRVEVAPADQAGPITTFREEHFFLSNFYPHPITLDDEPDGRPYPTVQHAFQAAKTTDPAERERVRNAATPAAAKVIGKRVTLRPEWDTGRFEVMLALVRRKFADPELTALLLATGDRELIEGNSWRDVTWGCVREQSGAWRGQNRLGQILMRVREETR